MNREEQSQLVKKSQVASFLGSKGQYRWDNPGHLIIFNANFCSSLGKLDYGDIDITVNEAKVVKLAAELGTTIYILNEMDGRFENEQEPKLDDAVYFVTATGETGGTHVNNYERINGRLIQKPEEETPAPVFHYSQEDYTVGGVITIETKKYKENPLVLFWQQIRQLNLGIDDEKILSKIYLSLEDYETLKKQFKKYVDKEMKGYTDYRKEQTLTMEMFMHGPNHFQATLDWAPQGTFLIKKDKQ